MQEKEGRRKERTFECKLESTEQGGQEGGWGLAGKRGRGKGTANESGSVGGGGGSRLLRCKSCNP